MTINQVWTHPQITQRAQMLTDRRSPFLQEVAEVAEKQSVISCQLSVVSCHTLSSRAIEKAPQGRMHSKTKERKLKLET